MSCVAERRCLLGVFTVVHRETEFYRLGSFDLLLLGSGELGSLSIAIVVLSLLLTRAALSCLTIGLC
jgi:hypothetical protein